MNLARKTVWRREWEAHTKQTEKKKSREMVLGSFPVPPGPHSNAEQPCAVTGMENPGRASGRLARSLKATRQGRAP